MEAQLKHILDTCSQASSSLIPQHWRAKIGLPEHWEPILRLCETIVALQDSASDIDTSISEHKVSSLTSALQELPPLTSSHQG